MDSYFKKINEDVAQLNRYCAYYENFFDRNAIITIKNDSIRDSLYINEGYRQSTIVSKIYNSVLILLKKIREFFVKMYKKIRTMLSKLGSAVSSRIRRMTGHISKKQWTICRAAKTISSEIESFFTRARRGDKRAINIIIGITSAGGLFAFLLHKHNISTKAGDNVDESSEETTHIKSEEILTVPFRDLDRNAGGPNSNLDKAVSNLIGVTNKVENDPTLGDNIKKALANTIRKFATLFKSAGQSVQSSMIEVINKAKAIVNSIGRSVDKEKEEKEKLHKKEDGKSSHKDGD